MKDLIEKFSTDFYKIVCSISNEKENVFVGEALVYRQDTNEEVDFSCAQYGNSKDEVENELYNKIKKISLLLSSPPADWNSKGRYILAKCLKLNRSVTNYNIHLEKIISVEGNGKFEDEKFFEFCAFLKSETITIVKEISVLPQNERVELLASSEETYNDPTDPWNLDDLSVRHDVFQYYINPSTEEINAHERHAKRLQEVFSD